MYERLISVADVHNNLPARSPKLIALILARLAAEYGPQLARDIWKHGALKWSDLMDEAAVDAFLTEKQLHYVTDPKLDAPRTATELLPTADKVQSRIRQMLEQDVPNDDVFAYVAVSVFYEKYWLLTAKIIFSILCTRH